MGAAEKEKITAEGRKKGLMSSRRCHLKKRVSGGQKRTVGCGFVSNYEGRFVSSKWSCATRAMSSWEELPQTTKKPKTAQLPLDQEKTKEWVDAAPVSSNTKASWTSEGIWCWEEQHFPLLSSSAGENKSSVTELEEFNVPCNLNSCFSDH